MVQPQSVDAEILARIAFAHKAGLLEQADGGRVGWDAGRFEPMQPQRAETERYQRLHGAAHQPAPRERLADPVSEAARLRDAAPDVGERQPAGERVVALAEEKERIRRVGALILGVAAQAAAERAAAQVI